MTLDLSTFDRLDEVEALLAEMRPAEIGTRAELETMQRGLELARERLHDKEIILTADSRRCALRQHPSDDRGTGVG